MNEKTSKLVAMTAFILFILFIAYKQAASVQAAVAPAPAETTQAVDTTPGMPSDPWYMNAASQPIATPGNSNLNITIDPWSSLTQSYMPLFGFVGVSTGAYQ